MSRRLLFQAFESSAWLAAGGLMLLAAVVLIVRLLRYERQLVDVKVGRWLLGLRLAVLALLALVLGEPVLSWTRDRTRNGRIVVAVDVSDSMSISDLQATPAEKLRWARGLGLIGNASIDRRLDGWITSLEAGEEPRWVGEDETADPARRSRLETVRRQNLQDVYAAVDKLTRRQIVERVLLGTERPLLEQLEEVGTVELRFFGGTAGPGDAAALDQAPPGVLLPGRTDLVAPLSGLGHTDDAPVTGVILFSDGRQTVSGDPLAAASRLGAQRVPVFAVTVGSGRIPRDLAVSTIDAPRTVFQGDTLRVTATIRTGGFRNQPVTVSLFPEDDPSDIQTRTIQPATDSQDVVFDVPAGRLGRRRYVVRAEPQPDELSEQNNTRTFSINVVDDVARVLLVDGEARWEFRFIDNALSRDERVEVDQIVFAQPFLGLRNEPFFASRLEVPTGADALQKSVLAEADLVIIGDAGPRSMSEGAWALLEAFVGEAGGTIVLVAGKRYLPTAYRSNSLSRLLPVDDLRPLDISDRSARAAPTERGFRISLTPEGQREPMLQFHVEAAENRRIWDGLAGHLWGLVGTARPGSTVLAHARMRNPAAGSRLDQERQSALFVHQYYGLGQVLWLGIDSTWRWRHRVGDTYHHRFWGQLARWAARNKATSGNESVRLGVEAAEVAAEEPVVVLARWRRDVLDRVGRITARAEFFPRDSRDAAAGTEPLAVVPLEPLEDRPLLWRGRTSALPPGDYQVRLAISGAAIPTDDVTAEVFVHSPVSGELTNLAADANRLAELARASDGKLVPLDQLDSLPGQLERSTHLAALSGDIPLWDHWLVMLLFFVLMTAEWVIRKIHGLP